jgi:hypothetical protein
LAVAACSLALLVGGCAPGREAPVSAQSPSLTVSGPRRVVEEYLKAATSGDGAAMYGLIATSERDDESPQTLGDTARDRYTPSTRWEVLKTEERDSTARVVVDVKGAEVDPNPTTFSLTREAGEWRIIDSPELHEREKDDGLRIKL